MATNAFPFDAVSGAPSYTGQILRDTHSAVTGLAPSGRPLGAISGVRPGTPTTTVTATSTVWTVAPHSGVLDLETPAAAGPYWYAVDANATGSVTAANATNPRIDIVYVQLSDPAESDGSSTPSVVPSYLAGTAASSPSPPATPARSLVLAQISVPHSGAGSPTVAWVAPVYGAVGFQAHQAGTSNVASSGSTWVTVPMDTLDYNPGQWVFSGGGLTIPRTGNYKMSGAVGFASMATGSRGARLLAAGSAVPAGTSLIPGVSAGAIIIPTPTVYVACTAGDAIVVQALQNSGSTVATSAGASVLIVEQVA